MCDELKDKKSKPGRETGNSLSFLSIFLNSSLFIFSVVADNGFRGFGSVFFFQVMLFGCITFAGCKILADEEGRRIPSFGPWFFAVLFWLVAVGRVVLRAFGVHLG